MKKLKLQVQISVDGYVAGPQGELDWMPWNLDDEIIQFIISLADSSDTILLGRKMTDEFVRYWDNVVNNQPDSPEYSLARLMVDTPKVFFSRTLDESRWNNTRLAGGHIVDEVNNIKKQNGHVWEAVWMDSAAAPIKDQAK